MSGEALAGVLLWALIGLSGLLSLAAIAGLAVLEAKRRTR